MQVGFAVIGLSQQSVAELSKVSPKLTAVLFAQEIQCSISNVGSGSEVGSGSVIAGTDGSSFGLSIFSGFSGIKGACSFSSDEGAFDSVGALTGSEEIAGPLSCLSSFDVQAAGSAASVGASVGAFGSVDTGSKEAGVPSCGVGPFGVFPAVCPCNGSAAHPESNTESRSAHNMRFFFMG